MVVAVARLVDGLCVGGGVRCSAAADAEVACEEGSGRWQVCRWVGQCPWAQGGGGWYGGGARQV